MESLFDLILFVVIVLIPLLANIISPKKKEDQEDQLARPDQTDEDSRNYTVKTSEESKPVYQEASIKNKNANSSLKQNNRKKTPTSFERNEGKQAKTQRQAQGRLASRIKDLTSSRELANSEIATSQIEDQARLEDNKIPQLSEEAKLAIVESDLFKSKKIAEENLAKLSQGVASKKEQKRRNKLRQMVVAKEILDKPLAYRKR